MTNKGNIEYKCERIKDILASNYILADCQRTINTERLEYLKKIFVDTFNPITPIYFCIFKGNKYLIDGQHRLEALKDKSLNILRKECLTVVYINVNNFEDISKFFLIINNQLPLSDVWLQTEEIKDILVNTFNYFKNKYSNTFSNIKRRPYISENDFQNALTYIINNEENNFEIKSSGKFIDLIENLNYRLSEKNHDWFPNIGNADNKRMLKIIEKGGYMYIGMLKNNWLDYLDKELIDKPMDFIETNVSNGLRRAVWVKYNGENFNAKCFCCKTETLSVYNFEAGHVRAKSLGGENTIENLRPICSNCNKTMQTDNMFSYMEKISK